MPLSAHMVRTASGKEMPELVIMMVRSRSKGATHVREMAPASPPAISRSRADLGGSMLSLHSRHPRMENRINVGTAYGRA